VARYTLTNLKQIEDQAPKFGLSPNLEARFARNDLGLENSGISYQRLAPGYRMPFAPNGLELLAFGAPNTGPQDAEPLPGWWTD
jgi:hypothetical protein